MSIRTLLDKAGGISAVAEACGVTTQAVSQWITNERVPPKRATAIETLRGGAVTRRELCPDFPWGDEPTQQPNPPKEHARA